MKLVDQSIEINGNTFWYNHEEIKMGSQMKAYLANTKWDTDQKSWAVYIDESVGLVIY